MVGRDDELPRPRAAARRRIGSSRSWVRAGSARPASRSRWRAPWPRRLAFGGCLVELAPVGDPAGVRAAVAAALALPDPSRLAELIGDRELLIVLDNCEHVIATAAEVAEDLLGRCPALRILATSREGLRVGGETVWPVPPLGTTDAVALFVARAHAAGAALELSDDHRAVIAEICARLDGLPLAIELAAARTRAFPLPQIRERLDDRFRLLTGGSRTALPRQQTLRAVVDWSYELLFDDEQRVFERLSVFPGGCDLATAEAVCADDEIAAADLADHLHALVDKSLVVAVSERRPTCASPSSRPWPSTAWNGSPTAARRCASATRWPRTSPRCARRAQPRTPAIVQRAWLTADRPRTRQPARRARVGGRERRRRDRTDHRGRHQLAALAGRH